MHTRKPINPSPHWLKRYVLAENIVVEDDGEETHNLTFDWLCPNCGRRHWAKESCISNRQPILCLSLAASPCSTEQKPYDVEVRFPWSDNTPRDRESVYGETVSTAAREEVQRQIDEHQYFDHSPTFNKPIQ